MKDALTWLVLINDGCQQTARLEVEGGWLYREYIWDGGSRSGAVSITFVPRPPVTGYNRVDPPRR